MPLDTLPRRARSGPVENLDTGVLRALEIPSAHVAGFSGGSIVSQELALRHPELVRSLVLQSTWPVMDSYLRSWLLFVRWLVEVAPSEGHDLSSTCAKYGLFLRR